MRIYDCQKVCRIFSSMKILFISGFFLWSRNSTKTRNNARGVRYHRPKRRIFHSVTLVQISDTNLHRHYEIRYLFQKPPHMQEMSDLVRLFRPKILEVNVLNITSEKFRVQTNILNVNFFMKDVFSSNTYDFLSK